MWRHLKSIANRRGSTEASWLRRAGGLIDSSGGIAVALALMITALAAVVGGSVDLLRAKQAQTRLQNALDAAVLHASLSTSNSRLEEAASLFATNVKSMALTGASPNFTINADRSVSSEVNASLATVLLRLIHIEALPVKARATAAARYATLTEVEFTPISAQGAYAKDMFVFIRDAGGSILEMQKVLSYDYDWPSGSGTVTPPINTTTQKFILEGGSSFGVMMRVFPDLTLRGSRDVPYVDYYSDDPEPNVVTSGECSTSKTYNWEDGGDNTHTDFIYKMHCTSMVGEPTTAKLTQ